MKIQAIIPAAGLGTRFKADEPKPFVQLGNSPIFIRTCEALENSPLIDSIILVVNSEFKQKFEYEIQKRPLRKIKHVVVGGETRSDSVYNGLSILDNDTDYVVVHDAARPKITQELIESVIQAAKEFKAAIAAVPIKPTIKRVDAKTLLVKESLSRDELWEIQTPQVFEKNMLLKAHEDFRGDSVTDDAMLIEKSGQSVKVVMGDYQNIKITTLEDLLILQAMETGV